MELIIQQAQGQQLTNEQANKVMPLLLEYQKLQNQGAELGLPEKQSSADFWKDAGEPAKILKFIKELIK